MSRYVKYVTPVTPATATDLMARVYAQMRADLGRVAEPVSVHAADPAVLAGTWATLRETLLVGRVPRGTKEAVAGVVSALNRCPWCLDAHSIMVHATGYHRIAKDIGTLAASAVGGRASDVFGVASPTAGLDPELVAILRWAAASRSPGHPLLASPPFLATEAPEIIGVAVTFHYLTRVVNVTLVETFLMGPGWLRGATRRLAGQVLGGMVRRHLAPGASLALLPDAMIPDEFHWAASSPAVAGAFARLAAAVETAGASALSDTARAAVLERLSDWHGEDPGISRSWVERDTAGLAENDRAGARLALLTALAPHQVDAEIVEAFRRYHPSDASLIGAISWGSFAAARRTSSWLAASTFAPRPTIADRSLA
ncbi:MAG TPA: hypothetical protein VMP10_01140 [Chloroflexota bacterium]|nr:hypothetical protein [Chloroflexota bacterium]